MNTSEFSSEEIVKYLFTGDALASRPATWRVALHTGNPGLDGAANEATYSGYGRVSTTFTADQPSGAGTAWRVRNDADVTFAATDAAVTITHVTVFDANTNGNCLVVLELPIARSVASGGVFSIPANELVITGD